jgi:hypothetical protein
MFLQRILLKIKSFVLSAHFLYWLAFVLAVGSTGVAANVKIHNATNQIELASWQLEQEGKEFAKTIDQYKNLKNKITDYKNKGVDVKSVEEELPVLKTLIFGKTDYQAAQNKINELSNKLETLLAQKQEANKKAAAQKTTASKQVAKPTTTTTTTAPAPTGIVSGYSKQVINGKTVYMVTANLSSTRVLTITGDGQDCDNDCTTRSLGEYVGQLGGWAGINGTYFCPVDYASCANEKGWFYWMVYNSQINKLINYERAHVTYDPFFVFGTNRRAYFFSRATDFRSEEYFKSTYGTDIMGAIGMRPALVIGSHAVVDENNLEPKEKTAGNRSFIANKGDQVIIGVVKSANLVEVSQILESLGIDNAINLDDGGSTALFVNGSYVLGPGRNMPNAVVFQ